MPEFFLNPIIYDETGEKELFSSIQKQVVWIVCDSFLKNGNYIQQLIRTLEKENTVHVYSDIIPDPPLTNVIKAVKQFIKSFPDTLIAVGGGSAIDTAKAAKYFAEQYVDKKINDFIIIPTTSGSGSEVSSVAVVTDTEKQIKYPLFDDKLLATKVVLNPHLVTSCPKTITIYSGIDVLTHALEALVARNASHFSDGLAEKAIELVFNHLPTCATTPDNVLARKAMHEASCMAGLSFQNAGLGIVHAISHQIGGIFHLTHGLINGLLLPKVVILNATTENAKHKYAQLAKKLNLCEISENDEVAVNRLIEKIEQFLLSLEYPRNLEEAGASREEVVKMLPKIIQRAEEDFTYQGNPIYPTREQLAQIIVNIM